MAGQTIAISVLADTAKLKSGLSEASDGLGTFGKSLAGIGVAVGAMAVGAAVGIGKVLTDAVRAAGESQKVAAQTEAVVKSTGMAAGRTADQIGDLSLSLSRMSGVDDEVIQSGANVLATFTQIKGVRFDEATGAALDLSVALGKDMASSATLVGKALNDPIAGIGALSKVGVQLTDDQKALVKSMTDVGDIAGAQGVILGVLNEQFGGSAAAFGNTFEGAVSKAKTELGNLQENLGTVFLPGLTGIMAKAADALAALGDSAGFQGFINNLGAAFDALVSGDFAGIADMLLSARGAIVDAALGALGGILDAAGEIIPKVIASTADLISTVVTFLAANAPMLLQGATAALTGIIQAVVQILPPLITTLAGLLPQIVMTLAGFAPTLLGAAVQVLTAIVAAVPVIIPPLVAALVELIPTLIGAVLGMLPQLADAALTLFLSLVQAIPQIIPPLIQGVISLLPKLVTTLVGMLPKLVDAAVQLFVGIVQAIPVIIPQLIDTLIKLGPEMVRTLIGLVPVLLRAGVDLIAGLVKGLWEAASSVGSALLDIAKSAIGGFLDFLGIHSPSRLFAGYGGNLVDGLVKGLRAGEGDLTQQMGRLANTASGSFDATMSTAPLGVLGAKRVRSDYRTTATPRVVVPAESSVVQLSPADRALLMEIADRVGITIAGQALQATVNGANGNAVSRRAG